jgi:hypothetical protein
MEEGLRAQSRAPEMSHSALVTNPWWAAGSGAVLVLMVTVGTQARRSTSIFSSNHRGAVGHASQRGA